MSEESFQPPSSHTSRRQQKNAFVSGERRRSWDGPLQFPWQVKSRDFYINITVGNERLYVSRNSASFRLSEIGLPALPESIYNLLPNCTLDLAKPGAESKRKPPLKKPGGTSINPAHNWRSWPLWLSFGTAGREGTCIPATLSEALSRPHLVYPLASLDVSGQWPVFHADASPNEVSICCVILPPGTENSQGPSKDSHVFFTCNEEVIQAGAHRHTPSAVGTSPK